MNSVVTEKGTVLPLINLKGKSYLMVAHRLQWLAEKYTNYTIETELVSITDEQTVAKATITLLDETGKVIRKASATKRETKKDFADHTEKAETAACGRALAMLGLGTQHAISDLDEGNRIVDSPMESPKQVEKVKQVSIDTSVPNSTSQTTVTTTSFRKPVAKTESKPSSGGWR
jgi:hypothetical protein